MIKLSGESLKLECDLLIIGGGPSGLSTAIETKRAGLDVLVVDKGTLVNSVQNFPASMVFFSTSELLEIGGIPFVASSTRPARAEAVNYYARVARSCGLKFRGMSRAVSISRGTNSDGNSFSVEIINEITGEIDFVNAKKLVIATGFYDNPNMLGVPGENLPTVSHFYREPGLHYDQKVVIVGGRNSAVEAALDLYRHGVSVTIVHRGEWFGKSVKYWILPDIENRVRNGEIAARFKSKVVEIRPDRIIVQSDGGQEEIECDFVYALTGYHPDLTFLRDIGIEVDGKSGVPTHNSTTFETNVEGVFIAGSIVAGYDCNKIFIENGREHGKAIAKYLAGKFAHRK